jgi:hypothetical protein
MEGRGGYNGQPMRFHWYILCRQGEPLLATASETDAADWLARGREYTVELKASVDARRVHAERMLRESAVAC